MSTYVAITPRQWASDWDFAAERPTCTVWPEDDAPKSTGLVNAAGVPLYRVAERVTMGFRGKVTT